MKFNTRISTENLKNWKYKKEQLNMEDEEDLDIDKEIETSYSDKCKNDNEEYVSIEDIDRLVHGMYLSDDSQKELGIIKRYLEKLILIIERSRIREYMYLMESKKRLFIINFIAGLGKGLGQAVGFTILAAIVIRVIFSFADFPIIGKYIADLMNTVEKYRK